MIRRIIRTSCLLLLILAAGALLPAQITTDILGSHDIARTAPITGGLPACQFCHAPHSGLGHVNYLWSQKLSTTTYTLYDDPLNPLAQPALGSDSNLCLSCHDGTVAVGQTTPYGNIRMQGGMFQQDVFGTDLSSVHPFNFKDKLDPTTANILLQVIDGTGTGNPAVKLIKGNVQCTSCHEPHNQFIDPVAQMFLVVDNSTSTLCLACHITTPANIAMSTPVKPKAMPAATVPGSSPSSAQPPLRNTLETWTTSAHALSAHKISRTARVGRYGIERRNGCLSCHSPHNAKGGRSLLSGPSPAVPNMDAATQSCITCHNGSSAVSPALPNVFAEFAKTGHPFPSGSNRHNQQEDLVLKNNRHATCVDCHNPHASRQTASFRTTTLRESQKGTNGVSAADGVTVVSTVANQYENCLRCHGSGAGKQTLVQFGYAPVWTVSDGDPLNVIPQFARTATSKHPVMVDRSSPLAQPSLLQYMWNLNGTTQGREMGTRILCSDCHNSDDNREFGGSGPNGPHGSTYPHILERRYEMSQVTPGGGAGTTVQNLFPNPELNPSCTSTPCASPYALCAKCHDLKNVLANASFNQHARHINDGFSCSVCHTAHGIGAMSASVTGERLVAFDANVVGPNGGVPISYNRGKNTCTLTCHNVQHNANGTVSAASRTLRPGLR